jgi:hypothetical protein
LVTFGGKKKLARHTPVLVPIDSSRQQTSVSDNVAGPPHFLKKKRRASRRLSSGLWADLDDK